ncbi:phosphorylase family protein [Tanticharoenia sakaeratensis]|jgi:adenosylhomocysteine nucleosidase|uniref:Nucleoside phosphorylase domain-containing protein n=1 Tax=Tanticharoenia sakaeratensis NBRC 103193 TaxID=1231623 RepID=A0A0D6MM17_9PROT|nr:hypothetical protein [Tanticharoenia sakaeratensis]GAN54722.1 hypothetical protein Tasa_028_089 [Tanticharoenia sakaeratensis NBRC 103193]GBQ16911.1 hypothetical protein AA103193_0152 [Tanticharoenia sakaeratensis NBRC 103193]
MTTGVLVGLKAEARIVRKRWPDLPIAVSGATREGAERALGALLHAGVDGLLSFGVAAGLKPGAGPGTIVVPSFVMVAGERLPTDPALSARFGADRPGVLHDGILHSDVLVTEAVEKARLYKESDCAALDMESGLVAGAGLPFAALRVICDDCTRDLPHAAAVAIEGGGALSIRRLLGSLLRDPGQVPALIALGRDAARAREKIAQL